jgi:ribosomal protein S18 acetylase RimI-like enzyme
MNPIKFQQYNDVDKQYVWETYVRAMKPHIEKMWGWDDAWQKDTFEKSLIEYETFMLLNVSERVGYVQVKYNLESTFLSMLILSPHWQSKGIGPNVLDTLQSHYREKPITLRCFQVNKSAFDFYSSNGFEVVSTDDYFISMIRHRAMVK